jgi:4-amino-4-deoxychorismate lyase
MSLLFETIRLEGGKFLHLGYHNARLNHSRAALFHATDTIDLADVLVVPHDAGSGTYRCRADYSGSVEAVTFTPYTPRPVHSLQLVNGDRLEYAHKYSDRSGIHALQAGVRADDILIVRNGLITDSSYANVVFFDGKRWVTPASPLLPGTTRARLLDDGVITAGEIGRTGLGRFTKVLLINAMLGFDPASAMDVDNIIT